MVLGKEVYAVLWMRSFFLRYCLTFILFLLWVSEEGLSANGANISPIRGVVPLDWVSYSSDGTKLAVVKTVFSDSFYYGVSLSVYQTDSRLQPGRLLFHEAAPDRFFTDVQWAGSHLFYCAVSGIPRKEIEDTPWMVAIYKKYRAGGLAAIQPRLDFRAWPNDAVARRITSAERFLPTYGGLYSPPRGHLLLTYNDIQSMPPPDQFRSWTPSLSKLSLSVYDPNTGRCVVHFTGAIPQIAVPWYSHDTQMLPLDLVQGGKSIVAVVSSNAVTASPGLPRVPSVISINLTTGKVTNITPNSDYHGLVGADPPIYYDDANPIVLQDKSKVIGKISAGETADSVIYRFDLFSLGGKDLEDVLISDKEIAKAHLPQNNSLLTWTPDGDSVVVQGFPTVSVMNYRKGQGYKIASGYYVTEVHGWIDPKHLLVKARRLTPERKHQGRREPGDWMVLSL